jgi:hypothetical protein
LAGGPYALMQGVAWAGMLVNYSKTDGLAKAAVDTFSGEKPCELCCKITEAKQEDARQNKSDSPELTALANLRHEMLPAEDLRLKPPFSDELPFARTLPPVLSPGIGHDAPPSPPPQVA